MIVFYRIPYAEFEKPNSILFFLQLFPDACIKESDIQLCGHEYNPNKIVTKLYVRAKKLLEKEEFKNVDHFEVNKHVRKIDEKLIQSIVQCLESSMQYAEIEDVI